MRILHKNTFYYTIVICIFTFVNTTNLLAEQPVGIVSLENLKTKVDLKTYYIADIIDARDEKNAIGIKKWKGHKSFWFFKDSVKKELLGYINTNLKTDKKPLILRINKLWLSERKNSDDFDLALAEVSVSFLEKRENNTFDELLTITEKAEKDRGVGKLTTLYTQVLATTLDNVLKSFLARKKDVANSNIPLAAIGENALSRLSELPIFNTPLKRGFFMTLSDLRENKPIEDIEFIIKPIYKNLDLNPQKKLAYYEVRKPNHGIIKEQPFAFCDEKNIYATIYNKGEFQLLTLENHKFYLTTKDVANFTEEDRERNLVGSILLFGVGAVAIDAAGAEGGSVKKARKTDLEYDVATGLLRPNNIPHNYSNQIMLIYPANHRDSTSLVTFKIDGQVVAELPPHSYYLLNRAISKNPLQITTVYKGEEQALKEEYLYNNEVNCFIFGYEYNGGVDYTKRYLQRRYDITKKPSVDYDFVYREIILTQKFKLIK